MYHSILKDSLCPPGARLLLSEDPQQEAATFVRLKGGGDDDVLARWKVKAVTDLARIDEGAAVGHRLVLQEHLGAQVDIGAALELRDGKSKGSRKLQSTSPRCYLDSGPSNREAMELAHTSEGT